ncbi:hypothetical protein QBC47DRAFT_328477 [Echria macrotheca]|uniref:NAD(P)-binding protein n=1 Tax=Echria macrotheca TaxID=438768 RepID=A0AAJ0F272_9PEZI|nr:hypothetical protein QBC47DRAFT_328477 [Echria macrotheca]
MPTYVVAGGGRGLGYALVRNLSADPGNLVVALVRDVDRVTKLVAKDFPGRENLHLVHGDLMSFDILKSAAEETAKITGGSVDMLIANAAMGSTVFVPISEQALRDPAAFEAEMSELFRVNVIGSTFLLSIFMPLVRASAMKKVVVLSTGMGDPDFIAETEIDSQSPYAISKAALNMAIAKFHAEYRKQGVLIMGISPGIVDTGSMDGVEMTPEIQEGIAKMGQAAMKYAPEWKGPISPDESVAMVLDVVGHATIENNGGKVVSHLGTKRWL